MLSRSFASFFRMGLLTATASASMFAGPMNPAAAVQAELMQRAIDSIVLPEMPVNLSGFQSFVLRLEQNGDSRIGGFTGPNAGSGSAPALFPRFSTTSSSNAATANVASGAASSAPQQQRLVTNPNEGFQVNNSTSWVNPDTGEVIGPPAIAATRAAEAPNGVPPEPVSLTQASRLGISDIVAEAPGANQNSSPTGISTVNTSSTAASTPGAAASARLITPTGIVNPIPEPATGFGIGIALIAAGLWTKRRRS